MKKFKLTQENMDRLSILESLQSIADHDRKDGNEYGFELINQRITNSLQALGLSRRVARDMGWDF